MNSIMAAAMAGLEQRRESDALIRLRDQLVRLGVNAELRDNNAALMVHRPAPGLPVWVFVNHDGTHYAWHRPGEGHPVDDAEGAANVLAAYVAK